MFKNYSFDKLWNMELTEVEAPNYRRGGWSGVCTLREGDTLYYVKRQENHFKRTWTSFIVGELTFKLENHYMKAFKAKGVPALDSVYFEERRMGFKWQAILVTKELKDYTPLNEIYKSENAEVLEPMLKEVGRTIRIMHDAGFVHRALHPKHLFINNHDSSDVKFIDLEKVRVFSRNKSSLFDDLYRASMTRKLFKSKRMSIDSVVTSLLEGYGESPFFVRDNMESRLVDKLHGYVQGIGAQ